MKKITLSEISSRYTWNYFLYRLVECSSSGGEIQIIESDDLDYIRSKYSELQSLFPMSIFVIQRYSSVARIIKVK